MPLAMSLPELARWEVCWLGAVSALRADPTTDGDCPNFAQSAEQNGTVPFSEAVFG